MTHTKVPERDIQKVSTYAHTHTHTNRHTQARTSTHTSVFLAIPTSVRMAQARSRMLREEPIEKNVKYTVRLRTHT
jgi:hypothetical protein